MLINYLKIAIRNLYRHKGFSLINILGLAIGMSVAILIMLWVRYELSYDKFHSKSHLLYQLVQTQEYASGPLTTTCMPGVIGKDIQEDIPEITNSFMYYYSYSIVRIGEDAYKQLIMFAAPQIFEMLDIEFIDGDPGHVFDDPNSIVISNKMAGKYFKDENPIGKTIQLDNEHHFKVTGVVEDLPENSVMDFVYIVPFEKIEDLRGYTINRYGWNAFHSIVELHPNADYEEVNEKIAGYIIEKNPPEEGEEYFVKLFMFPFEKLHLYSVSGSGGGIEFVYIFSAIAVFVLIIACVNFINLSTARSLRRSREIGLRKTAGANRKQIITQFLGESVMIAFLSMIVAVILVYLLLPAFNQLVDRELVFKLTKLNVIVSLIAMVLFVGILAGIYPAIYLSSFKPIKVLKSHVAASGKRSVFRRVLVISQFTISIILIICTLIVSSQMYFLRNKNLGMELDDILYLNLYGNSVEKYDVLKDELLKNPNILSVSQSNHLPFWCGSNSGGFDWEGKDTDDDLLIGFGRVGYDYTATMGIKMVEGRYFDRTIKSDTNAVIMNSNAIKAMGMENPVGKWLEVGDNNRLKIIGVMEDFHFLPMQHEISPLMLFIDTERSDVMLIKINGENSEEAISHLSETWDKVMPGFPLGHKSLKARHDKIYRSEKRLGEIFGYFTILAIFISCLGLFGLATYMAEQRTKEIGIRKVMGATVSKITLLVSSSFVKWVLLANIIAWPIAWYAMKQWLDGYAYHIRIHIMIFVAASLVSLLIALLTVAWQAIKAATRNPAMTLKYE